MRVLVGCETTQTLCRKFIEHGYDAMSCDLKPGQKSLSHYQGNVLDIIDDGWDLAVFHPECTYLTNAGNRWLHEDCATGTVEERLEKREEAIDFFLRLQEAKCRFKAIENPWPHPYVMQRVGRPDDKVQPYYFGSEETKGYCWWLYGLPPLMTTFLTAGRVARVHAESPGHERSARRSVMCEFMADAIVRQWGPYVRERTGRRHG